MRLLQRRVRTTLRTTKESDAEKGKTKGYSKESGTITKDAGQIADEIRTIEEAFGQGRRP